MKIIIANSVDLEQAHRLVELAWAEFRESVGQPFVEQTPALRRAMVWLAWQACKIEREAQEEVRRLAIEEEREACAKIADDLEFKQDYCYWQRVADDIGEQIRARTANPP